MEDKARAHIIISGRVQGVFFRVETQRAANRIGVFGWVRNRSDGTVEAVFEGDRDRLDAVLQWCQEGPAHANVIDVNVTWNDYTGEFQSFEITY